MTAAKSNGGGIKEQGPKTYVLMRERIEAAAERDAAFVAFKPSTAGDVLAALRGRPADETLPAGTALPVVADVEQDGNRGPRPPETSRDRKVAAILAACAPLSDADLSVLAWIAARFPTASLRAACEAAMAKGWCATGAKGVTVPATQADRARGSLLSTVREVTLLILGPAAVLDRRSRAEVLADARKVGVR